MFVMNDDLTKHHVVDGGSYFTQYSVSCFQLLDSSFISPAAQGSDLCLGNVSQNVVSGLYNIKVEGLWKQLCMAKAMPSTPARLISKVQGIQ